VRNVATRNFSQKFIVLNKKKNSEAIGSVVVMAMQNGIGAYSCRFGENSYI
jgi:hypothetical protein